eukprot:15440990-Alexandrium_andersonii.AAC.1
MVSGARFQEGLILLREKLLEPLRAPPARAAPPDWRLQRAGGASREGRGGLGGAVAPPQRLQELLSRQNKGF